MPEIHFLTSGQVTQVIVCGSLSLLSQSLRLCMDVIFRSLGVIVDWMGCDEGKFLNRELVAIQKILARKFKFGHDIQVLGFIHKPDQHLIGIFQFEGSRDDAVDKCRRRVKDCKKSFDWNTVTRLEAEGVAVQGTRQLLEGMANWMTRSKIIYLWYLSKGFRVPQSYQG